MRTFVHAAVFCLVFAACFPRPAPAGEPSDMFMLRTTDRSMDEVAAAAKRYAEAKGWLYFGENRVDRGRIAFIKFCVPAVAGAVFEAGMHVAALLPCGNLALYQEGAATGLAMLHPKYMNALYPDPNLKKAGEMLAPEFEAMLSTLAR